MKNVMGELNMRRELGRSRTFQQLTWRGGTAWTGARSREEHWSEARTPDDRRSERLQARPGHRRGEGGAARDDEEGGVQVSCSICAATRCSQVRRLHYRTHAWCGDRRLVFQGRRPEAAAPGSETRRAGSTVDWRTSEWSTRAAVLRDSTCSRRRWAPTPAGTSSSRGGRPTTCSMPAPDVQGPRRRAPGTRHRQHVGAHVSLRRQEAQGRAGVEVRRRGREFRRNSLCAPGPQDQGAEQEAPAGSSPGWRPRGAGSPAGRACAGASRPDRGALNAGRERHVRPPAALFMREKSP